jgi:hypothetical protein
MARQSGVETNSRLVEEMSGKIVKHEGRHSGPSKVISGCAIPLGPMRQRGPRWRVGLSRIARGHLASLNGRQRMNSRGVPEDNDHGKQ